MVSTRGLVLVVVMGVRVGVMDDGGKEGKSTSSLMKLLYPFALAVDDQASNPASGSAAPL